MREPTHTYVHISVCVCARIRNNDDGTVGGIGSQVPSAGGNSTLQLQSLPGYDKQLHFFSVRLSFRNLTLI